MKFHETHFEEYINAKENLHPKLEKIFAKFPIKIHDLKNLIFYGPNGVGKYTQMLKSIRKYSHTDLKYEKKISVTYNKQQYFFKISDIHYEIDMSLLGCNSKLLWHEIYSQIVDIVSAKTEKSGIIVCKYFNEIHSELLDNFYSYMQKNTASCIDLKYILITEELSFIPDNILNCCEVINIPRPTKSAYNKCLKNKLNIKVEQITNIKNLHSSVTQLMMPYKIICDKILDAMIKIEETKFLKFRDLLYDIFIYNLDITDCVWYIISTLIQQNKLKKEKISELLIKTYSFFQFYNNNYRPIYHLENYLFFIVSLMHNYKL
uniref:Replication factor C C-terminal domain-containing protein n=1 Tax=viral metagenome TaxID=1070528 RepID=A0A6C0HCL5_9ZZZZ